MIIRTAILALLCALILVTVSFKNVVRLEGQLLNMVQLGGAVWTMVSMILYNSYTDWELLHAPVKSAPSDAPSRTSRLNVALQAISGNGDVGRLHYCIKRADAHSVET